MDSILALRLKRESRANVDRVETLALLAPQEREVHLVCQGLDDQESMERRAVRGDRATQELLDHPVGSDLNLHS